MAETVTREPRPRASSPSRPSAIGVSLAAIVVALAIGGMLWQAVTPRSEPMGFSALISRQSVEAHLAEYLSGAQAEAHLKPHVPGEDGRDAVVERVKAARRQLARDLAPIVFPPSLQRCLHDAARTARGVQRPEAVRLALRAQLTETTSQWNAPPACGSPPVTPARVDALVSEWAAATLQTLKGSGSLLNTAAVVAGIDSRALLRELAAELGRDITPETMNAELVQANSRDLAARFLWAASGMLFSGIWIASVIVGLHQLFLLFTPVASAPATGAIGRRARQRRTRVVAGATALSLTLGIAIGWASFQQSGGDLPNELLGYFSAATATRLDWWANIFAGMAGTASCVLITCAWAPLWLGTPDTESLGRQLEALRVVLNAGTALLVTAMLEIATLYRWPATLIADEKTSDAVAAVATAGSVYAAVTFSVVLVALYMPPAYALRSRAAELSAQLPEGDVEKLMSSKGFGDSAGQQVLRLAQAFAPLISAIPVAQLFSS